MYFHKTPFLLKLLYPGLIWEKSKGAEKSLYLTFDDGPIPGVTEFILDVLNDYNAKATFFCVGENMVKHPAILEKAIKAEHSIGNHTFHHLNGWKTPDKEYLKDVADCDSILDNFLGKDRVQLFRPPYGRMKRSQFGKLNYEHNIIMWDVLSGDFDQELSPEDCLAKSIQYTKSGSIIVFHDSNKAKMNMHHAFPGFIDHFSKQNFIFSAL
ncbi:MAG: polysaccharide deacetylase family protein [Bacteroidota bacterium]|nr:polysaccharide deacetylase family protein [Bacteroidota bacterium]